MFCFDVMVVLCWMGNFKQYQVGFDINGNFQLLDLVGKVVLSNVGMGFMLFSVISFWIVDLLLFFGLSGYGSSISNWLIKGFWQNSLFSKGWVFDLFDGEIVEKGGVGEMLCVVFLISQVSCMLFICNGKGICLISMVMLMFDMVNIWLIGISGLNIINLYNSMNGVLIIVLSEQINFINWVCGCDVYVLDNFKVVG